MQITQKVLTKKGKIAVADLYDSGLSIPMTVDILYSHWCGSVR